MKKIIAAVASLTAIAGLAAPTIASASVDRYQTSDATFTLTQPAGSVGQWVNVWTHNITVHVNPCDNTFTGTGIQTGNGPFSGYSATEKVTGSFGKGTVSLTVNREDGVSFSLANAATDSTTGADGTVSYATSDPWVSWPLEFHVSTPQSSNISTWKNHGDYVSSQGGGADAAHSCIGMPVQSSK